MNWQPLAVHSLGHKDPRDQPDRKARQALKGNRDHKGPLERQDLKALRAIPETPARLAPRVTRERPEVRDHKVRRVMLVRQELPELRAQLVRQDLKA